MALAAAIGPLVGGELTERFGWRAVFAANLPVIAVSLLMLLPARGMHSRAQAEQSPLDWMGSALLAGGLSLVVIALRVPGGAAWWLGGAGAVLLISAAALVVAGAMVAENGPRFLAEIGVWR